jgi:cellulose synthase/poly-beta-1,6-N-acetylglucosamine synthase-like glycosyltransferase
MLGVWVVWVLQALWGWQNACKFRQLARSQGDRRGGRPMHYDPPAVVVVPVKGADEGLLDHLAGLTDQDYRQYRVACVVESADDPAYPILQDFAERYHPTPEVGCRSITVLIAGLAERGSQKVHNQLAALAQLDPTDEVIVFADADAVAHSQWLGRLVIPLKKKQYGVTTGYRWLVPSDGHLASRLASVMNASVATLGGPKRWNLAWGGSMAIRRDVAEQVRLVDHWRGALSDDYQMTRAVRQSGLQVYFVARSMIPSPVRFTWASLLRFGRRQYMITRLYAPLIWLTALGGHALYTLGTVTALIVLAMGNLAPLLPLALVYLFDHQRARTRQDAASLVFEESVTDALRPAFTLERWATPLWMGLHLLIVLSSALGRTIRWAGITYFMRRRQDVRITSR